MSVGISKNSFALGLMAVLLASLVLNYAISTTVIQVGPKGEKGDTGLTGPQGPKGDKGDPGGVEPDVTASLDSTYHDVWGGTDYHIVEGLIINFGSDTAYSVTITITWHITGGGYHTESPHYIGTLKGHEIYEYSKRYDFEGKYDYITWEITWS